MSSTSVAVIGGGLAGLSSAVALAEAGCSVRLLEKRPFLGGRAASYLLPDGNRVDNCQHVTLGCCTNLSDFYRRIGAENKIRFYDRLHFADGKGRRSTISASWLPPPFHLAPAFLLFSSLGWAEKKCIAQALLQIVRKGGCPPSTSGVSMLDWLNQRRQTPGAIKRFWRVVLVSALDEELAHADARYGVDVFWKTFLLNREGYRLGIPAVPLSELYRGCHGAIESRGGEVRCRTAVRSMRTDEGKVVGVLLDDGEELRADFYISAVPHGVLLELLPGEVVASQAVFSNLRRLRTSPITGVHFWFDRPVMTEPYLALLDHTTQWIFNKSLLYGPSVTDGGTAAVPGAEGQYLQLVISASYDLIRRSRREIIDLCRSELGEVLPAAREARLLKATVVKEVDATFSPEPGADQWRPGAQSALSNLVLAGDWTATGWPATMESAVRSGYRAAEVILESAGAPREFLQPDLPAGGFCSRWAR